MYLDNIKKLIQFCTTLGLYDSSGPSNLSIPKYGVLLGKDATLEFLKNPDETMESHGNEFVIPLLYDRKENPDRKTLIVIRRERIHPAYYKLEN